LSVHGLILSRVLASDKPGAIHNLYGLATNQVAQCSVLRTGTGGVCLPHDNFESLFQARVGFDHDTYLTKKQRESALSTGDIQDGRIKIFSDVEHIREAAGQFRKENDDLGKMLRQESVRGCMASMAKVPGHYRKTLDELLLMFPNFAHVIRKIRSELTLAMLTDHKMFRLETPLLLLGPAGVGKTFFLNELAKRLGILSESITCSDASAGFMLSGLTAGFATGHPGLIYKTIVGKRMANPMMILDELDKSGKEYTSSHTAFENVFYTLLEPLTACHYKDECMQVEFDASHIAWVATANELDSIAAPIRDRFDVIEVPYPTSSEREMMCKSLYKNMISTHAWGANFSTILDSGVVAMLSNHDMSIRQIKKELYGAIAMAAEEHLDAKASTDSRIIIRASHFRLDASGTSKAARIGFIH